MRSKTRLVAPVLLGALVLAGLVSAPTAAAACNDSSGTTVCAQGEVRGTEAPPPAAPTHGAWGTWCSGGACYSNYSGLGIFAP